MKKDQLLEKLDELARPLESSAASPEASLIRLIEQTHLRRDLLVEFGSGRVSVRMVVASARVEKIVSAKGVRAPREIAGVTLPLMGNEITDILARFLAECIELGGMPQLRAAEMTDASNEMLLSGLSVHRLAAIMLDGNSTIGMANAG